MVAIELVKPGDGDGRTPDPDLTKRIQAEALERNLIVLTAGTYVNVIRIIPPLVTTADEVDTALADPRREPRGSRRRNADGSHAPWILEAGTRAARQRRADPGADAARARVAAVLASMRVACNLGVVRGRPTGCDAHGSARASRCPRRPRRGGPTLLDEAAAAARDTVLEGVRRCRLQRHVGGDRDVHVRRELRSTAWRRVAAFEEATIAAVASRTSSTRTRWTSCAPRADRARQCKCDPVARIAGVRRAPAAGVIRGPIQVAILMAVVVVLLHRRPSPSRRRAA